MCAVFDIERALYNTACRFISLRLVDWYHTFKSDILSYLGKSIINIRAMRGCPLTGALIYRDGQRFNKTNVVQTPLVTQRT